MSVNEHNIIDELHKWYESHCLYGSFDRIHPSWQSLDEIDYSREEISQSNFPNKPCLLKYPSNTFSLDPILVDKLQQGKATFDSLDEIPLHVAKPGQNFTGGQQIGCSFADCRMKNMQLYTCNFNLFTNLTKINTNAICAEGFWFTPAHVEEAGHDSCAYLASGLKLWFGATNLNASRYLVSQLTYPHRLINMLSNAPSESDIDSFRYHVFEPGQLILQPSLFAHTVITFKIPGKISFIAGWEAANLSDEFRVANVLDYFGTGYRRLIWRQYYQNHDLDKLKNFIDSLEACELKTHFYALLYSGYFLRQPNISTRPQPLSRKHQMKKRMLQNRKK